jgi:hypothetical protein
MPKGSDSFLRPTMTFVSRCRSVASGLFARNSGLVRSSQWTAGVVSALLANGCLIPDPPTWDAGKPTRPQLVNPNPSTSKFIALLGTSPKRAQDFEVYEVSEDVGHALRALWYLNFGMANEQYINFMDIAPGHLDIPKPISVHYNAPLGVTGCFPFTIVVTHAENQDPSDPNHHPTDPYDTDSVTWWLNINDNSENPNELNACPM